MDISAIVHIIFRKLTKCCTFKDTAMKLGRNLNLDVEKLNSIDPNYGDWFVHPCVRYIKNGFAGHKWWMVVTPYPHYNSYYENPILYYGCGETENPPTEWRMVSIVSDSHIEGGYNADGNIYYDGEKLWIIWKENDTTNTIPEAGNRVVMGCYYDGTKFSKPKVIAHNRDAYSMYLASPVLLDINDKVNILGVFSSNLGDNTNGMAKKPRNIAVFKSENNTLLEEFKFTDIAEQEYKKGFDFWHIDNFKYNDKYYCVVTPESGNEILLGESQDGFHYKFFDKPLLHECGIPRLKYMYKASGVVVSGVFYLFHPLRVSKNRVHIYCTSERFADLLNKLKVK